jgi:subtilisin family serine protease
MRFGLMLFAIIAASPIPLLAQTEMVQKPFAVIPGQVLVKFRKPIDGAQPAAVNEANTTLSAVAGEDIRILQVLSRRTVLISLPSAGLEVANATEVARAASVERTNSFMTTLQADNAELIEYTQPNYAYYPLTEPNDPLISQLRFREIIKLNQAWDIRRDAADVVVAVIDTGVMLGHPDIKDNLWTNTKEIAGNGIDDDGNGYKDDIHGWNFYIDPATPGSKQPDAELVKKGLPIFGACLSLSQKNFESHGTHVSGTIGARGDNAFGIAGAAWKIKLMPLKFLGGSCGFGDTARAIQAIDYAAANGAKIINCSWGGKPNDGGVDRLLEEAIVEAGKKDVLVICAAGNSSTDNDSQPHYPSNFTATNLLSVGATDDSDAKAKFSNWGLTTVDVFAPGVNIHSTIPQGDSQPPTAAFGDSSGTSMASPIVSGVAALVRAQFPGLSAAEVRLWLMKTTNPIGDLKTLCVSGGRINAQRALTTPEVPTTIPASFGTVGAQAITLSDNEAKTIKESTTPEDRIRMVLFGGMSLDSPKTTGPSVSINVPSDAKPLELMIAFSSKMDEESIKKSCASVLVDISKVEVISASRNVFRIQGKTSVAAGDLEESIRKAVPNVRLIQPNYNYQAEVPK